ncbi:MAG: hypothetical protein ALECFALPRED_008981 [Alectoria fallacina]|uniref:Zinc finger PHD-type domain-containing protein n=1 Tax=Alectoria fallacina TaxID=1903189 RepID=A0A8H3J5K9_9LECA|nr:MAG: hypothetical protein ALECFALPRED_008981 [Alectoria fallacina]
MSKLSELLNPAPSSAQRSPPPGPQPLILDGQDHRAAHRSSFDGNGTSPTTRFASLTSPGLEALAAAASSTAPILSPPQSGTFAQSGSYQGHNQYGSRPGSSHTLPPLSNDFSHAGNQLSTHASGLEQYHHSSTIGERKLSNETDHSARLPPFVRSPPTQSSSFSIHAPGATAQDDLLRYANGDISEQVALSSSRLHDETEEQYPYQHSEAPAISQIRQPSPGPSDFISASTLPETQSDQVEIKAEVQESSLETPQQYDGQAVEGSTIPYDQVSNIGAPALKSITDIKNDASHTPSPTPSDSATMKPKPAPSKKRAAPKKGTASTVKPPAKKRKIESDSVGGTPPAQLTGTPATSRASQTPVPKNRKQGSVTPARSSSILNGEEDDDDATDDGELFCICRKPDDHTLMIACDGPCDGWFHGRCVDMPAEKTKLISKWYCGDRSEDLLTKSGPDCVENGNETLWKRMCRLEGCGEPARDGSEGQVKSKYCSNVHGEEFMRNLLPGEGSAEQKGEPTSKKKRRRDNYTDNFGNTEEVSDDDHAHLGGVLKPSELKALTDGAKDLDAFRRLGDGVLSPPTIISPEGEDVKMKDAEIERPKPTYTPEEMARLESIAERKIRCRAKRKLLDDRDKLLLLITTRAKNVLAEMREQEKSLNTICGYDSRLTWSEDEFNEWRTSPEGQKALQNDGVLGAPTPKEKEDGNNEISKDAEKEVEEEIGRGVCKKKRCERHKAWFKLQQQDNLFEKDQARQEMKKLDVEERGVRDRAMIRCLEGGEVEG